MEVPTMTVDEVYDQCLQLSPEDRLELLCSIITKTVVELGALAEEWEKELAKRSAMESSGIGRWLPSPEFMAKFQVLCRAT
jgi:hypothetical protein